MYLYSVWTIIEKANAPNGIKDWIIAIINHVVGGHWRQTVSLKREKANHKSDKTVVRVLLLFSKVEDSGRFCHQCE